MVIEKLASQVTFLANFDVKMSNYVRDRFCDTAFLQYEFFLVKFSVFIYCDLCNNTRQNIVYIEICEC